MEGVATATDGTVTAVPAPDTPPPPADAAHRPGRGITVTPVPVAETYALRARVLRAGGPPGRARLDVDDRDDTAAFAARTPDGQVVGTAIVYPEPCPWMPGRPSAWRLRGMATAPGWRGGGIGARVLAAVAGHVVACGGTVLWCNARLPARRFYERAGFVAHGEPWGDPEIGPHVAMARPLGVQRSRDGTGTAAGQ